MIVRRLIRHLIRPAARDGLDVTGYIRHVENDFAITLNAAAVGGLRTLADMVELVIRRRSDLGLASDPTRVWRTVRRITAVDMGVDASELRPETRFAEDLCC